MLCKTDVTGIQTGRVNYWKRI